MHADVQLLLFAEKTLPRQARDLRHAVRVRVLPAAVPDQEQSDHAQELAAQGHGGRAQASDTDGRRRSGVVTDVVVSDVAAAAAVFSLLLDGVYIVIVVPVLP